jgi:hypothetical protein
VDLITTSLCLESVANTVEDYFIMINKIANLLKPKGYFVMFGALE